MMVMMTVKVLVMTGVVLHHVFLLWSQDKINESVLPESFRKHMTPSEDTGRGAT